MAQNKQKLLEALYQEHYDFKSSPLYITGSSNIIFGEGNVNADIVFIGEAPGKTEELEGRPFVGQSGQLLNRALELAGLDRSDVYITNIVKCRPPNNRTPSINELIAGRETLLIKQLEIIKPRIICTLGSVALRGLTQTTYQITKERGQPIDFMRFTILPTFHPAYILRNKNKTPIFFADIKKLIEILHP